MADRYETRITPIEIGDFETVSAKHAAKPVSVRTVFALCFAAGLGTAIVIFAVLLGIGAAEETLLAVPALLGLAVAGTLLVIRAIPWEWIFTARNAWRNQQMIAKAQARENEAYRRIRQLVWDHETELQRIQKDAADQVAALQRALDRVTLERDTAKLELQRMINMNRPGGRQTFVTRERAQTQDEKDARQILDRWFNALPGAKRWTPRREATTVLGFSEERWRKAVAFLERSGIVVGQEVVIKTLDIALAQLSDYATASSQQPIDVAPLDWAEEEGDSM